MITIRIQLKPKKDPKEVFVNIITVVILLLLLRRMPLQKTPLITRKQLACLSGGTVGTPCANPLNFGTPFSFCGGKSFATTRGIIHHICVKEEGNIPFPDSQNEPLVINKYKLNSDYPAEVKILKTRGTHHPSIPIFLEPRNQISKSTTEGGKGVTYVGHWKVTNVNSERNRAYDSRAILATVNFSFDRFDDNTSNIIHRAYNKTCHEIKAMNFDEPENRHLEMEPVPSSGENEDLIFLNNQSISQDQVQNSSRPTLSDEEHHVEVESMSSAVELSSDSDAIRNEYSERASITDSSPEWVRQLAETTEPVRVKSQDIFEEQEDYIRAESSDEDAISMLKRENKELKRKVRELAIEHSRTKLQIQRLEKLMHRQLDDMRRYCHDLNCSPDKRAKLHQDK